jgi:hypothetical protein
MTGGPKRKEEREYEPLPRPAKVLVLSDDEQRWDAAIVVWRSARQFQRRAKRVTRARGISFARWQLLDVTERLIRQKGDAVSLREVALGAQVGESTVSDLMGPLMWEGLVDIGPDAWGTSYRIWMTELGERLVASLRAELLDLASMLLRPTLHGS